MPRVFPSSFIALSIHYNTKQPPATKGRKKREEGSKSHSYTHEQPKSEATLHQARGKRAKAHVEVLLLLLPGNSVSPGEGDCPNMW